MSSVVEHLQSTSDHRQDALRSSFKSLLGDEFRLREKAHHATAKTSQISLQMSTINECACCPFSCAVMMQNEIENYVDALNANTRAGTYSLLCII